MEGRLFVNSPVGILTLTCGNDALTGLYFGRIGQAENGGAVLREAERQLCAYFAGRLRAFDLPLAPSGTPFQLDVWRALSDIPYGETRSYGDIARAVNRPKAFRAVGMANHMNPISIIVPCHRVVGADGSLTGYGGGLEIKRFLLRLEGMRGI